MFKKFYISLFAITTLAIPLSLQAQVDPAIDWKTMHLPHFDLIYDAHHQELAKIYAARLEGAYANLSLLFPADPVKTLVVIDDRTDLTNGSATVFPYPTIMAYPALPAPQEIVGEYNDWASELVTHELTHILAMHPQRDNVHGLSYIFGTFMSPNMLLPRWWNEGVAVEMETRFSNAGRLRSPLQDAWLRSYLVDNRWNEFRISDANEVSIPTWPYGARPYIMGSALWSELLEFKGLKMANDLSWAHGGRFPYLINEPAKNLIGMYYYDLFDVMREHLQQRLEKQLASLKKTPPTKTENLGFTTLDINSPTLSPDGLKLAVSGKDPDSGRRRVFVITRPSLSLDFDSSQFQAAIDANPNEVFTEMKNPVPHASELMSGIDEGDTREDGPHATSRVSWMPDSKSVIYDSVDELNWFHDVSDLYSYSFETKKFERLSKGLRAREPVVSPDGKTITFVKVMAGKTEIANFDIATKKETETLVGAPLQGRCSYPSYLDANTLVFSYREHGKESLEVLDIKSHKVHRVLTEFTDVHFPAVTNGQLIFTSSVNGVPNLYLADKTLSSAKPVTHTLTAIYQSTWDWARKQYYMTEQTTRGLQITRLLASNSDKLPAQLPKIAPVFADRYAADPANLKTVDTSEAVRNAPSEDYSSWGYVLPHYWMPWFSWDSFSSYLSAATSGGDPLGKHLWSADGIYDIGFNRGSYVLSYLNTQTSAQIAALVSDVTVTLPGVVPDRTVIDHLAANWEVTPISPYMQAGLGWTKLSRVIATSTTQQTGPSAQLYYSNFVQSGAQISPESGFGTGLALTGFLPGSNMLNYYQAEFSFVKYWSQWLPKRHALMTKFQSYIMDQYIPANYAFTYSQALYENTALPQYLMRAYPSGTFQGRVLNDLNIEYRLPFRNLYKGWDTSAMYLKQFYGAIIVDGVSADGLAYNFNNGNYQSIGLSQTFWSVGAEGRLSTTVGYEFPMTFYFGFYMPTTAALSNGGNYAAGIFFLAKQLMLDIMIHSQKYKARRVYGKSRRATQLDQRFSEVGRAHGRDWRCRHVDWFRQ